MQKRLFVAIKIQPDQTFIDTYKKLKIICKYDKINWVPLENIHITLYFMGNTDITLLNNIIYQLKEAADKINSFEINISNIGIFGSNYKPKIIWLGIEPIDSLNLLSRDISNRLYKIGFQIDRQNFVPHITLGRIQHIDDKKTFQNQIDNLKSFFIQKSLINNMFLFESTLTKKGAIYNVIETINFKAN